MKAPATDWRERHAPDEEAHFARAAAVVSSLQESRSVRYGPGRALHRKPLLATAGTLEVLDGLPDHARHGLFARPGRHRVLVRLSNGSPEIQSNGKPDIRGFALKVLDVTGPATMGGTADHQDFLMINQDRLPTPDSREFVDFVEAATGGELAAIYSLFRAHGVIGGFRRLRALFASLTKRFAGFAAERFNTVAPVACGPYAVKVRLRPVGNPPPARHSKDIAGDMRERLAVGAVLYALELQFFVDEATTPIEDLSRPWPDSAAPVVTVARLSLALADAATAEAVEKMKFDPWGGLADHRPLGEVMRARRQAYFASQQGRGA
jgi:hypothetical protein